jgi:hypothetical protein
VGDGGVQGGGGNVERRSKMDTKIVCLSTKFYEAFQRASLRETLAGNIVLSIGCSMKSDAEHFAHLNFEEASKTKRQLDWLHFEKIKMADEVLILDVEGYIGLSTCDELWCARAWDKKVRFLSQEEEV